MEKIQDQDSLATLIHQWDQDHYDIFELSNSVHFFPVLVKGLYQTESYSLHVMQLIRI
jgi:hypothetical protein